VNPLRAQRGQTFLNVALETRIAPGTGAVIDADRLILLDGTGVGFGGREFDFAHRHADVGMQLALDVNAFAARQLFTAVRFERLFGCDHKFISWFWRLGSGEHMTQI
jgi:hypothetical protein